MVHINLDNNMIFVKIINFVLYTEIDFHNEMVLLDCYTEDRKSLSAQRKIDFPVVYKYKRNRVPLLKDAVLICTNKRRKN